jgi:recombination protein RecA
MYGTGISRSGDLLDQAVKYGIVDKSGAWFKYQGENFAQGKENAKEYLESNSEVMDTIEQQVKQVINSGELPC